MNTPAENNLNVTGDNYTSGYTCMFCGAWVNFGIPHNCQVVKPEGFQFSMDWFILCELKKITALLEEMMGKVEKETSA
jgi:hypothetical protein